MNDESPDQTTAQLHTPPDGYDTWNEYWTKEHNQPWRTEPEIDAERQWYLAERRAVEPDIEKGIYPFRDESGGIELERADIEWLLATHESGGLHGPVDWEEEANKREENQRERPDLRGAVLREVDLSGLPLAAMLGGAGEEESYEFLVDILDRLPLSMSSRERRTAAGEAAMFSAVATILNPRERLTKMQRRERVAAIHLEGANLSGCNLEGAILSSGHLEGATLRFANLRLAMLDSADLSGADLERAHLQKTCLKHAQLPDANLRNAHLELADLRDTDLAGADLSGAHLEGADLKSARLVRRGTSRATLVPTNLQGAYFDSSTQLDGLHLGAKRATTPRLADIRWNGVNVSVIDWGQVRRVGEEYLERTPREVWATVRPFLAAVRTPESSEDYLRWTPLKGWMRYFPAFADASALASFLDVILKLLSPVSFYGAWNGYRANEGTQAVRAYRQLTQVLRSQGLNDVADHFAYRAHILHRRVLRLDGRFARYLGSLLLDWISGYGYKPVRSLVTYIATIATFAVLYWCVTNNVSLTHGMFTQAITWLGMSPPPPSAEHLQGYEAAVVSMTSFHGRGFFQPTQSPGDKVSILAAVEAAIGLLIEITFIATFTQRFFVR